MSMLAVMSMMPLGTRRNSEADIWNSISVSRIFIFMGLEISVNRFKSFFFYWERFSLNPFLIILTMRRCEKRQSRLSVVKKNVHSEDSQFTLPRCEIFNLTHISKARRKGNCLEAEEFKTTKVYIYGTSLGKSWLYLPPADKSPEIQFICDVWLVWSSKSLQLRGSVILDYNYHGRFRKPFTPLHSQLSSMYLSHDIRHLIAVFT